MSTKLISASAFALALAISSPVFAESLKLVTDSVSMPVSYADLDVSSAAGIKALKARIERTAEIACGSRPFIRDLKSTKVFQSCVDDAVSAAIASSGVSALAANREPSTVALAKQ